MNGNVITVAAKQKQYLATQSVAQRNISSKAMRQGLPIEPKPAPFPYKEKRYNFWRALFDPTTSRFDENTKLIVVEGPPAAGKGALAQELAEQFDMAYFKAPTMNDHYINDYGYDFRKEDHLLPESCKSYDENDFLKNPTASNGAKAARFQLMKYELRYQRYLEALAHILNTGQGVVTDRSPYSDLVYIAAMYETGIVSRNGKENPIVDESNSYKTSRIYFRYVVYNHYHKVRNNSLPALWRPHLVIYLDVPVAETRRRIEARNRPHENTSKATTETYLQSLEDSYKKSFLKDIRSHI